MQKEIIKEELAQLLSESPPYHRHKFSGRGIVICAGGPVMLTNAYVLIRILREKLGCTLPIEVWHLGRKEMPGLFIEQFNALSCTTVDAFNVQNTDATEICDGWRLKTFALLHSSFEEVLLLDADQVPVEDPACVFDWPEYLAAGAVFWPDIVKLTAENPIWDLVGLPAENIRSWESGQICINKTKNMHALTIAQWMGKRADVFYQLLYGDKDTFLIAWKLTGTEFFLIPHLPMQNQRYFAQRTPLGKCLFQHRTNCKWHLQEKPYKFDNFVWQSECLGFLEDLRSFWNGRCFTAPDRSIGARKIENELIAMRHFKLSIGIDTPIAFELLPGHQIGQGRDYRCANWHVGENSKGFEIVFHDHHKPSFVLHKSSEGLWQGHAIFLAINEVFLEVTPDPDKQPLPVYSRTLADEFIDAALHEASETGLDSQGLAGALKLLSRLENNIAETVCKRATRLSGDNPETSAVLKSIGEKLAREENRKTVHPVHRGTELFLGPGYRFDTEE